MVTEGRTRHVIRGVGRGAPGRAGGLNPPRTIVRISGHRAKDVTRIILRLPNLKKETRFTAYVLGDVVIRVRVSERLPAVVVGPFVYSGIGPVLAIRSLEQISAAIVVPCRLAAISIDARQWLLEFIARPGLLCAVGIRRRLHRSGMPVQPIGCPPPKIVGPRGDPLDGIVPVAVLRFPTPSARRGRQVDVPRI